MLCHCLHPCCLWHGREEGIRGPFSLTLELNQPSWCARWVQRADAPRTSLRTQLSNPCAHSAIQNNVHCESQCPAEPGPLPSKGPVTDELPEMSGSCLKGTSCLPLPFPQSQQLCPKCHFQMTFFSGVCGVCVCGGKTWGCCLSHAFLNHSPPYLLKQGLLVEPRPHQYY